MEQDKKDRS